MAQLRDQMPAMGHERQNSHLAQRDRFYPDCRHAKRHGFLLQWATFGLMRRSKYSALFDHVVGTREQRGWYRQAQRLGGLKIDREFDLR